MPVVIDREEGGAGAAALDDDLIPRNYVMLKNTVHLNNIIHLNIEQKIGWRTCLR